MAKLISTAQGLEVKKSEAIVKSRYTLTPSAIKLITLVICNIKETDKADEEYVITVKHFTELTGQKSHNIYKVIDEALDNLLKNPIKIPLNESGTNFLKANWVSGAECKNGEIRFMVYPKLKPFLINVKNKYLKYSLENILKLKSSYSIRLYELLKDFLNKRDRYGNKTKKTLLIDELRELLKVPASYQYSSNIRPRIIEKAKKDFEDFTDIKFEYNEIKNGKKIIAIEFLISQKENEKSKNKYNFKSFVDYVRKEYSGTFKSFGYTKVDNKTYLVGVDNLGYMYGKNIDDHNDTIELTSSQSKGIYTTWLQIANNSALYQSILNEKEDIEEYLKIPEKANELYSEIQDLMEEGLVKSAEENAKS